MRTLALTLATILIAGCQTGMEVRAGGPPIATPNCQSSNNSDDCRILVNISVVGGRCTASVPVDQETVGVKKGAGDKWLWWQIDAAPSGQWRFTMNGIAPKSTTTGWSDNFTNDKLSDDGRAFRWKNKNKAEQAGREYKYDINLINANGDTCKLDPIIKNQL